MSETQAAAFIDTSVVVRYLTNDPPAMATPQHGLSTATRH